MRLREVLDLIAVRPPQWRRTDRVLARCADIEDLRVEAGRRWPSGVRGYVEGGADGEVSLDRNRAAYAARELVPATLRDVTRVDLSCDILGAPSTLPFGLGPTGYSRMMHPDGERAVGRAAAAAGIPYTVTTMSTVPLEELARPDADLWFQLYMWRDRGLVSELLERAGANGYRTLVLTVDTPVTGQRLRDAHHGFTLPPRLTPRSLLDMAAHPAWCLGLLRGEPITFANFAEDVSRRSEGVMAFAARQFDPSVTWEDVARLRVQWPGPLVIKGVLDPADARRARDVGADALIVSNHGGRQLDQTVAPLDALAPIREAVGDDLGVLLDSGIRRGSDLAVALAEGADACLVGRPYLYGLGAAGERGVAAAITMLADELARAMRLLGVVSVSQLRAEGAHRVRRTLAVPR